MTGLSTAPSPIQDVFNLVREPLVNVKESLLAIIPPDSVVLAETVQYSLTGGGKYLRPAITLLSGFATQSSGMSFEQKESSDHAMVEVAAVTEMIHVATLLHDDVIDQAELRRGKKTVRSRWGNKVSVLSGDYLLAQASIKLSKLNQTRLTSIFSYVLADLCDGEVEQMHHSYRLDQPEEASWESYYKKTICKTASLFSAGCESAGVVNGLSEESIQALKTYGRNYGIAFQIMDDLLDYTASEMEIGKPVLGDLRNGLLTAPILLAFESPQLSQKERMALKDTVKALFYTPAVNSVLEDISLDSSPEMISDTGSNSVTETIEQLQALLVQSRALEETRALMNRYIHEACQALDFLKSSPHKQALLDLVISLRSAP